MRKLAMILTLLIPTQLWADDFDYYVLSLSWSASFCDIEGDAKQSDQCEVQHDYKWILHGLWPQYHQGWPAYCNTSERPPSRRMTRDMIDIMGSSGLAWHQWKKHGSCSGLSAEEYFTKSREAYDTITQPKVLNRLDKLVRVPASVIEDAFVQSNPFLERNTITITCKQGYIQEARVCLSKSLEPVPCGRDVIKDCKMTNALFPPSR